MLHRIDFNRVIRIDIRNLLHVSWRSRELEWCCLFQRFRSLLNFDTSEERIRATVSLGS